MNRSIDRYQIIINYDLGYQKGFLDAIATLKSDDKEKDRNYYNGFEDGYFRALKCITLAVHNQLEILKNEDSENEN